MSSSISVIEVDLDGAAIDTPKGESISLMPKKMPSKLGITDKYPVELRLIKNLGAKYPLLGLRSQNNGAQLIINAAAKAVSKLQSLPAEHKETFASGFIDLTAKLHSRTDEFMASRTAMPAEMPDPLP
jgi:hypothetical protein